jgi:hypothetical protein
MDKKYRLTKIKLDEVSLVGAGDDARANVILSKSDSSEGDSDSIPDNQLGGNGMGRKETPAIIDKSALPDDVREYIDALEDVVLAKDDEPSDESDDQELEDEYEYDDEDSDDEDEADDEERPPVRGRGVKVGKTRPPKREASGDDKVTKSLLSKADPEVRELITKMETRVAQAESIAKHERDERERREWIAKAQSLTHINDNPDQLGGLLKALHDKAPDEATAVEKLLRAANSQVAKSGLWDEVGRTGGDFTGTGLDMKVAELRKADPTITKEQAEVKALELDPSLYDEYLSERGM